MSDTVPTRFTVPLVEYTRLAAKHGALKARLAEAERDAARYRWIRSPRSGQAGWWHIKYNVDPEQIDAAIDTAMAADSPDAEQ